MVLLFCTEYFLYRSIIDIGKNYFIKLMHETWKIYLF